MAVRTAHSNTARADEATAAALEVIGRPVNGHAGEAADVVEALNDDEALHALRLLALDNLIDLVNLREALAERDARISELETHVETWRQRSFSESSARERESAAAYQRQRELVSVLHRQLIENDALTAELAWRRLPWWRRIGRRPTPASALSPAPG